MNIYNTVSRKIRGSINNAFKMKMPTLEDNLFIFYYFTDGGWDKLKEFSRIRRKDVSK